YDVQGRIIATLVDDDLPMGEHAVVFDANSLPSGVYFYRLTAGPFTQIRKAILMK
ncbi:MAG: T9SS type A sorting domain-containing protein, partial [bacterium]